MFLWPEVPKLISVSYLTELDREAPGTWMALPKIDGRRRVASNIGGAWTWRAKNRGDCMPVPPDLRTAFESLPWPAGVTLDMELSGPRHVNGTPELHIFDILTRDGDWMGNHTFGQRYAYLRGWFDAYLASYSMPAHVRFIGCQCRDLVAFYERQKENPLSEGVVIRRATSTMKGSPMGCVEAKTDYFKVKFK